MKQPNPAIHGFTLVEVIFAIGVIAIMALISLPLAVSKLKRAEEASADASIREIATALTAFLGDLRAFPTCHASDCSMFPGTNNKIVFLAFGNDFGSLAADYPAAAQGPGNWDFSANGESITARNNGANHLVVNDPNANGTPDESSDYPISSIRGWQGPYIAGLGLDPWGKTIIAYVGAMEQNGRKVSGASGKQYGWILSAGPDNSLQTTPSSNSLQNDDRGFILFFR